jgi:hypothetical protein
MDDKEFIRSTAGELLQSENDKRLWDEILQRSPEKILAKIRRALEADRAMIKDFTRLFKKMAKALLDGDRSGWSAAVEEQKRIIESYRETPDD